MTNENLNVVIRDVSARRKLHACISYYVHLGKLFNLTSSCKTCRSVTEAADDVTYSRHELAIS